MLIPHFEFRIGDVVPLYTRIFLLHLVRWQVEVPIKSVGILGAAGKSAERIPPFMARRAM